MSQQIAVEDGLDWDVFVRDYWDRRPVLVKNVVEGPFTPAHAFDAACRAANAPGPDVILTVDGVTRLPLTGLLPTPADGDFDGYAQRLLSATNARHYSLVMAAFHSWEATLWQREAAFLHGLWARVGLPVTGAITTLFHGPYRATPVGAHKDRFATMMFLQSGRKRMRFWRHKPWEGPATSMQCYEHLLEQSFVVEPEVGDLLYWPSDYFHVGEGADEYPATSVNIGLPRCEHRARFDVETLLVDLTTSALMNVGPTSHFGLPRLHAPMTVALPGSDGTLPAVPEALDEARRHLSSALMDERLEHVSRLHWRAQGLQPMPDDIEPA